VLSMMKRSVDKDGRPGKFGTKIQGSLAGGKEKDLSTQRPRSEINLQKAGMKLILKENGHQFRME